MSDNFLCIKRPRASDDERDILQMQNDFFENRLTPCVKVVNLRENLQSSNKNGKLSKFAADRKSEAKMKIFAGQTCGEVKNFDSVNVSKDTKCPIDKLDPVNIYASSNNIILGNIVERTFDQSMKNDIAKENKISHFPNTGFPAVFTLGKLESNDKESIFCHNFSLKSEKEIKNSEKKTFVCDSELLKEIHEENLIKLKEMSEEQILTEKKNLESTMDPKLLQLFKSMKKNSNKQVNETTVDAAVNNCNPKILDSKFVETKKSNCISESVPNTVNELVKSAESEGWVHMDNLELEKLEWMHELPANSNNKTITNGPEEPYNARFDFQGILLPYDDGSLTVDKGLHHHGDEPHRPGYSLQEILQLIRSASLQQRCTALITLANIIDKTQNGWYDSVLQPPLLTTLNQKNILLLLRFAIDDTSASVVAAGLQALKSFLFNQTDEICLDKIFGFENFEEPILQPDVKDVDKIESLKDYELAQYDTVMAALRTDIVARIRFLLSEMQLPPVGNTAALEILTRLCRHSKEIALNIGNTPDLLDIIIKKYMPLTLQSHSQDIDQSNKYKCPLSAALRFFRILAIYGGRPIIGKLVQLKVPYLLLLYISTDARAEHVKLHIESLRLWRLILDHGFETDSIIGARLTIMSQLRILENSLDLESPSPLTCDYAAALLAVTKYDHALKKHVSVLIRKWSTQMKSITSLTWSSSFLLSEAIKSVENIECMNFDWLTSSKLFLGLCSSSNLLSTFEQSKERFPDSIPNLNSMTYEGKLQPIVSQCSCIIFMKTVIEYLIKSRRMNELQQFLNNPGIVKYLNKLKAHKWYLENSWFTRIEYSFLILLIEGVSLLKDQFDECFWKISTKLISALPADKPLYVKLALRYSFKIESNLNSIETSLRNLKLENQQSNKRNTSNFIIHLYESFLIGKGKWFITAMPKDWLFLPLVDSYTRAKNGAAWNESWTHNITVMLHIMSAIPELSEDLSISLKLSRILLLFLCDSTFLHFPHSELAEKIIRNLITSSYNKLNLSDPIPGLSSFNELFTALCEHFNAQSYNSECFTKVLLIFIAQRYDVHYRKLLWSEHADALRYCKLTSDQLIIPLKEYLYPIETDASLIETYITALVRNNIKQDISPVPYKIALHHSAMYLKSTSKLSHLMRTSVLKLVDDPKTKSIADSLLNYQP